MSQTSTDTTPSPQSSSSTFLSLTSPTSTQSDSYPASTSNSTPTPSPFQSNSRYEIRPLTTPTHALWATALIAHGTTYHSPIFSKIFTPSATRFDFLIQRQLPLVESRMNEGWRLSFGIFDREFKYRTEEARDMDGKLYWDWIEEDVKKQDLENMSEQQVLGRLDFPLVSLVLSYDGSMPADKNLLARFAEALPGVSDMFSGLEECDVRHKEDVVVKQSGKLLRRNATNTRPGYGGQGLSKDLTHYLMREARRERYEIMQVEVIHDALMHILMKPPNLFESRIVGTYKVGEVKDKDGNLLYPDVKTDMTRVLVSLR